MQQTSNQWNYVDKNQQNLDNPRTLAPKNGNDSSVLTSVSHGLFYPLNGSETYLVEVDVNQGTLHLHSSHILVFFQRGDIRGHACPHGYGNQSHVAGVCP